MRLFGHKGVVEEDYNEDEITDDSLDFESILDITSAMLPQNRLNWHYRSRVEELIAFSNEHFYENTLVTFPSSKKDAKDAGVEHYFVEGGIFDRTSKTNRKEAEEINNEIFDYTGLYFIAEYSDGRKANGKLNRKSVYGNTRKDVKDKLLIKLDNVKKGIKANILNMTAKTITLRRSKNSDLLLSVKNLSDGSLLIVYKSID